MRKFTPETLMICAADSGSLLTLPQQTRERLLTAVQNALKVILEREGPEHVVMMYAMTLVAYADAMDAVIE